MPFGVAPRIRSAVVCGLSTEAESERDAGGVMIRKFAFNAATQIKACFRSASLALVGDALSCSRGDKHPQARSNPQQPAAVLIGPNSEWFGCERRITYHDDPPVIRRVIFL